MIEKIEGTKNGYRLVTNSTDADLRGIWASYPKVRCLICNAKTMVRFRRPLLGNNIHTVNNHVGDDEFYINSVN